MHPKEHYPKHWSENCVASSVGLSTLSSLSKITNALGKVGQGMQGQVALLVEADSSVVLPLWEEKLEFRHGSPALNGVSLNLHQNNMFNLVFPYLKTFRGIVAMLFFPLSSPCLPSNPSK